jgi:hypothetical protein
VTEVPPTAVSSYAETAQPRHEPVFILVPPRSYSTVTVAVLAGHPCLYGFPEMLVFDAPTVSQLLNEAQCRPWRYPLLVRARRSGILRAVTDVLEESQSEDALARTEAWLLERSAWKPAELFDYLLSRIYPLTGIEKSPDTCASDQALDACLNTYPNARYLHLTRHPATTQRSMHDHWRRRPNLTKEMIISAAAAEWYCSHARIVNRLALLPERQWMRVHAEDILRAPYAQLPEILNWLGLPYDDQIISRMLRTENWRFADTGQSGQLFGGDPNFMRSPALRPIPDPGPVSFDLSWGLSEKKCMHMKALAHHLGY